MFWSIFRAMASLVRKFRRKSDKQLTKKERSGKKSRFSLLCLASPETEDRDSSKQPLENVKSGDKLRDSENMGKVESKQLGKGSVDFVEFGKEPLSENIQGKGTLDESKNDVKAKPDTASHDVTDSKNVDGNTIDMHDISAEVHGENAVKVTENDDEKTTEPEELNKHKESTSTESSSSYDSCSEEENRENGEKKGKHKKRKESKTEHKGPGDTQEVDNDFSKTDHSRNGDLDSNSSSEEDSVDETEKKDLDTEKEPEKRMKTKESNKKRSSGRMQSKILDVLSYQNFDSFAPEVCIDFMKSKPSLQFLSALNRKLNHKNKEWNNEFLDLNGFESLLDLVDVLGIRRVTQLSDAMLLLECIGCVKTLMNSKVGLAYLVEHGDSLKRLVTGKTFL